MKKKSKDGVTVRKSDDPKTWEEFYKAFLNLLPKVSNSHNPADIFRDVCRIFSLSIRGTVTISQIEKDEIEKQYQSFVSKYGNEGMSKIATLLAYTVEALELRRSDFLGHIYEALNATVKSFGQFLTPDSIAKMMGQVTFSTHDIEHGKIIRMDDPSCGAGALLIEAAEAYITNGGRQGDLLLYGEDLDATACCITYVQFSLLGYAAIVMHQDTLSMKVYEGPWYTPCYFAHGMPMRLIAEGMSEKNDEQAEARQGKSIEMPQEKPVEETKPINVRELVQGEFNF